ncbi:hypothetical protein HQ590_12855 [bacterium]|nr:hypothetical protein [bacterium]
MNTPDLLPPGLVYFWFLNDDCDLGRLRRQLRGFADAGIRTVILHPRSGLLVPYLSADWFELIRTLVDDADALGITCWLYDEDFCPSGSAAGHIAPEHPELIARAIERFVAPADRRPGELFVFPAGRLLWAGLLPPAGGGDPPVEQTDRVGMIRRHWEVSPWDSRWYYAGTPLYDCPRAMSVHPEYALRVPELPPGWRLAAFVARPTARDDAFGAVIDSLNPAGTQAFLACTYDRYAAVLGDRLGRVVPAIFTDEPKFAGGTPWTPGLFEGFGDQYGYDLRPRLDHLFEPGAGPVALATRLHYREWCGRRFREAWLKPVRAWCDRHRLSLVGHISPEEDLVSQALCVGNLADTFDYFALPGIDVIIPAVGDRRHPILNIGWLAAVSAAQQLNRPTALSETLGCSGLSCDPRLAGKILAWQTVSGIGSIVVHGANASSLGMREHEAPPDFGPDSPRWPGMIDVQRGLTPLLELVRNATQQAPVGLLWPIRSFLAESLGWQFEDAGRRKDLNDVVLACLEAQVGIQALDERHLQAAQLDNNTLRIGRAAYRQIVIPPALVLRKETLAKLTELRRNGFPVHALGTAPAWMDNGHELTPLADGPWETVTDATPATWCSRHLPKLLPLQAPRPADLRASRWTKDGREWALVMNLGTEPQRVDIDATIAELEPGELVALAGGTGSWKVEHRFDPSGVRAELPPPPSVPCADWAVRWPDTDWAPVDRPKAVYELRPTWQKPEELVRMCLTGSAPIGGDPVADWVEYRANVLGGGAVQPATLVLAPTAIRGRGTIRAGGKQWPFRVADTDTAEVTIDLQDALAATGTLDLVFRFDQPMPFDGIKLPPLVRGITIP